MKAAAAKLRILSQGCLAFQGSREDAGALPHYSFVYYSHVHNVVFRDTTCHSHILPFHCSYCIITTVPASLLIILHASLKGQSGFEESF